MPIPRAVTRVNRVTVNKLLLKLAGRGWFADLEHVGRRSGLVRHTPLLAFADERVVTVALTYGPDVDWLKNLRAAGGGRLRLGDTVLTLGAPRMLDRQDGLRRMPPGPRQILPLVRCQDFVEFPVIGETPY